MKEAIKTFLGLSTIILPAFTLSCASSPGQFKNTNKTQEQRAPAYAVTCPTDTAEKDAAFRGAANMIITLKFDSTEFYYFTDQDSRDYQQYLKVYECYKVAENKAANHLLLKEKIQALLNERPSQQDPNISVFKEAVNQGYSKSIDETAEELAADGINEATLISLINIEAGEADGPN
jgi:hypothetical protein